MDSNLIILLVLSILLVILALTLAIFQSSSRKKEKQKILKKLNELHRKQVSNNTNELRSLLIDFDKLLDHSLKFKGVKGKTMGERLKNSKRYFDKYMYNRIWEAHKARNAMVHEIDFSINPKEVKIHQKNLDQGIRTVMNG